MATRIENTTKIIVLCVMFYFYFIVISPLDKDPQWQKGYAYRDM